MTTKNWRETLFVWDGILSIIEKQKGDDEKEEKSNAIDVKWKGTWVGCDSADSRKVETPKRGAFNEFVSSETCFEVTGSAPEKKDEDANNGNGTVAYCVAMIGGPGYDLGEGDEKKKHTDDVNDVYFSILRWTGNLRNQAENIVFALGENEFGRFISVGWLRVGNRVTLARRYVDESDERSKWDVDDLRKTVLKQITTTGEHGTTRVRIPPWKCAAMHANSGQLAKRQKTSDK